MVLCCTDCGTDKLVWDWANGDVVCTACGLVAEERFVDDRIGFNDHDCYAPLHESVSKQVTKQTNLVNAALFNGMLDGADDISKAIDDFCRQGEQDGGVKEREVSRKADIASGVYANTKGFTAKELCTAMNVKPRQLWKAVANHKVVNNTSNRTHDMLKRTIYECVDIPQGREWEVFKVARKFLEAMQDDRVSLQSIKPDKLVVSLMVIACGVVRLNIKKKELCRKYGLSLDTLNKHEALLQKALEGQARDA